MTAHPVRIPAVVLFIGVFLTAPSRAGPIPVDPGGMETMEQSCTRYADGAVAQYRESQRLNCGHSGPAWNGDHNAHKQWCLATGGKHANEENRKRQAALKTCRESTCRAYARSAVAQQRENLQRSCGFSGPAWNADEDYHFSWCTHGGNKQRAPEEQRRRAASLAKCGPKAPLDGDFKITRVIPQVRGPRDGRFIEKVDILIEATSAQPWMVGNYGHHKYGSLWAEVTVNAKVAPHGAVQDNRRTYVFSVNGGQAGVQSFVQPAAGRKVGAGTRKLKLTVAPTPRIPLTTVEKMFSIPGRPFGPGETGCWYYDAEVSVKVFIVTTANLATVRTGKSGPIMNATMIRVFDPPKGGFNEGVIYHRCR